MRYQCRITVLAASITAESLAQLGYLYACEGGRAKAMHVIEKLTREGSSKTSIKTHLAKIYFALGEMDTGFSLLEDAAESRCTDLLFLGADPRWGRVREEKRFEQIMEKLGLPRLQFAKES